MSVQGAFDEYMLALRQGQKEYRELLMAEKDPYPAVLDELIPSSTANVADIGLVEIPAERIVGVKSAGRITAFTASFKPLLDAKSEFSYKWMNLCKAHMGETGITDPILCFEYLGNFYVQEGNKRVSVLRHFGAPRIPGMVRRILPEPSEEPRIKAYYEFLEFYRSSRLYTVQFRRPGDYGRLLGYLGKEPGEAWSEEQQHTFNAYFHYFQDALKAANHQQEDILPEEALLLWLKLYSFWDLGTMSAVGLKKSVAALWGDMLATSKKEDGVMVQTKAQDETPPTLVDRIFSGLEQLQVAFVHQMSPSTSAWVLSHDNGRKHIEQVFGEKILVRSYFDASNQELTEQALEQAVEDGAQVVFTTAPPLSRATLKIAVKYPKVRFLNCSMDQPYTSIRTYYGRVYEAKFITGAIAGAMVGNDRIGYIASYPILGIPASINAFALGAQLTNPRAQIELRWSCVEGTPQADFFADGIRVISNRDVPVQSKQYLDFCNYGTYLMEDRGNLVSLCSPVWVWGRFYEFVIRSILSGGWKREKGVSAAVNYWLGMDSGVIDLSLSDKLPAGLRQMAGILKRGIAEGSIDPFLRRITAQDGSLKNDGTHSFSPNELLHIDWLCDNVVGEIPQFDSILPYSRNMVRELGLYRDTLE